MKPTVAVIQFPGVNCEYETVRAALAAGLEARIVRWNADPESLRSFDGYILPGGFSYEDRVRAGAIAACEDIVDVMRIQAEARKPVLGICNGAQILVEAGLVPGVNPGTIEVALAPNRGMGRTGYYCDWVFLKLACEPGRCAITYDLEPEEVLPVPIAHAQGRFTSSDLGLFESLQARSQIVFRYCRSNGETPQGFPEDPNGSENHAAAICNQYGNVVALMPHPERSAWLRQVPMDLECDWSRRRLLPQGKWRTLEQAGPGLGIFRSLKAYIEEEL